MVKKAEYVNLFANLGTTLHVSEEVEARLERFVCATYGNERMQLVNDVRKKLFLQKFESGKKITDLSSLPPCQANLKLHIKRSNYVASIFRQAGCLMMDLDDLWTMQLIMDGMKGDKLFGVMYTTRMMLQSCSCTTSL